jgi:hypothetical protein
MKMPLCSIPGLSNSVGRWHCRDMIHHRGTEGTEESPTHVTHQIVGAAIEVHRQLGPGLLESTYESCLARELIYRGVDVCRQVPLPVFYRGIAIECGYRLDLVVEHSVIVEVKSCL